MTRAAVHASRFTLPVSAQRPWWRGGRRTTTLFLPKPFEPLDEAFADHGLPCVAGFFFDMPSSLCDTLTDSVPDPCCLGAAPLVAWMGNQKAVSGIVAHGPCIAIRRYQPGDTPAVGTTMLIPRMRIIAYGRALIAVSRSLIIG